jgi:fermentation-respiration switch protein FrsA (DUF1100 family)
MSVCPVSLPTRSWRGRLVRVLLLLLGVYLAMIVFLLLMEDRLLYSAHNETQWLEPPAGLAVADVNLSLADGTPIHAWWAAPAGWQPGRGAVLFCHGNGGNLSYRRDVFAPWQQRLGLAVLVFDYPGYGRSGGSPSEAGCYAAGDAALDWLTRVQGVPARRVILYGGSLGAAVATDLATRNLCRALFLVAPFTSFPDVAQREVPFLPGRWLVHNRFDNLAKIASCRLPVFIAHDPADRLIPISQGLRLFAAATGPKEFFTMSGVGHNDQPCRDVYAALRRFLADNELAGAPPSD